MSEETLQKARARWHSDDPMVCLQRALAHVEQLEQLVRDAQQEREQPPIERVIKGLANLARIADTLERLAAEMTAPAPMPTGSRGELLGALVGAAIGGSLVAPGAGDDDEPEPVCACDEPRAEGYYCMQCTKRLRCVAVPP